MKRSNITSHTAPLALSIALIVVLLFSGYTEAQRVTYESLQLRDRVPTAYFDYNIIPPASSRGNPQLVVSFKIEYDFLNFRTAGSRDTEQRFSSDVEIGVEIYEAGDQDTPTEEELYIDRIRPSATSNRRSRSRSQTNILQDQIISREFWNGTAYATTYEQTQSSNDYLEGYIIKELEPGAYNVVARFDSDRRTRNTEPRRVSIPDFDDSPRPQIYFLDEPGKIEIPAPASLINMSRNVFYGQNFNALFTLPDYSDQNDYHVRLKKVEASRSDTSELTVYDEELEASEIHENLSIHVSSEANSVVFNLEQSDHGFTYGLMQIPNERFENAHYRIELWKSDEDGEALLGSRMYQNRWVDIPVSLLNIDVAINMLRHITDDETLSELRSGNEQERVNKFRAFWDERNPATETDYNELMVEFYRRIDYAYDNFTTPRVPGYDSDMGQVYIRNGEPRNINRRFPSNQPAVEIWEYDSRSFTFVATTGFGDYELRSNR